MFQLDQQNDNDKTNGSHVKARQQTVCEKNGLQRRTFHVSPVTAYIDVELQFSPDLPPGLACSAGLEYPMRAHFSRCTPLSHSSFAVI